MGLTYPDVAISVLREAAYYESRQTGVGFVVGNLSVVSAEQTPIRANPKSLPGIPIKNIDILGLCRPRESYATASISFPRRRNNPSPSTPIQSAPDESLTTEWTHPPSVSGFSPRGGGSRVTMAAPKRPDSKVRSPPP